MDRIYQSNVSSVPPQPPSPGADGYVQSDIPSDSFEPTQLSAWVFHYITESYMNVIEFAGLTPDALDLTQLSRAIQSLAVAAPPPPPPRYGILDGYPENMAYGFARRLLLASWAGALYRVRRSSDNAERDIQPAADGTDTAALIAFVGSDSAYVVAWYDQTGNGLHLVQSNIDRQPMIVNAGTVLENVAPDGTDDGLASAAQNPGSIGATVYWTGIPFPAHKTGFPIIWGFGDGAKPAYITYYTTDGNPNGLLPVLGSGNGNSTSDGTLDGCYALICDTTLNTVEAQIVNRFGGRDQGYKNTSGTADHNPITAGRLCYANSADGTHAFGLCQARSIVGYSVAHDAATTTAISALLA